MKKMEFMRAAAKEFINFFEDLYVKNEYCRQDIKLKCQQGSFKLTDSGGTLTFYVYMTGAISYKCSCCMGSFMDYREYYAYDENDDHQQVIMKLRKDLKQMKKHLSKIFIAASFFDDPFKFIDFEYKKPFACRDPMEKKEGDR